MKKRVERNREIFAAYRAGDTVEQLAQNYKLAPNTVIGILTTEKHKIAVSADEFYQHLRSSLRLQPWVKL